jgi:antitoxin VapB
MKTTARLFRHGGSQAVRLPKVFRFEGTAVGIERRGDRVILSRLPKSPVTTLADVAQYLREQYPHEPGFPTIRRSKASQKRDLDW